MNDPQVWTVLALFSSFLGVMSAVFFAMLRSQTNAITVEIGRLDAKIDGVGQRLDAKIDGVGQRLDAKIDGVEAKLDRQGEDLRTRIDEGDARTRELMEVRFSDVDHRLSNVEDDLRIVKAHLIGQRSA